MSGARCTQSSSACNTFIAKCTDICRTYKPQYWNFASIDWSKNSRKTWSKNQAKGQSSHPYKSPERHYWLTFTASLQHLFASYPYETRECLKNLSESLWNILMLLRTREERRVVRSKQEGYSRATLPKQKARPFSSSLLNDKVSTTYERKLQPLLPSTDTFSLNAGHCWKC